MGYKVNPLDLEELRALAVQRLGVAAARESRALTAEQAAVLLEELALSKLEVEIQNEYLQETCFRLDVALNDASDLYNFAPVGCFSTDPGGKIIKLNLTGANLIAEERQRLIGRDFASFFVPGQRPLVQALMQQASLSGEDQHAELTLDGDRNRPTQVQLFLSTAGAALGYQMVLNNITRYKTIEEELRADEARWKFALDTAGDGVWDWDVQSNVVKYSPGLALLYGSPAEPFGSSMEAWRARVHPDDWAALLAAVQKCLLGLQTRFDAEFRGRCIDGDWKWIQCQGAVFAHDEAGRVTRMIGTQSDISRHKRMEEALREMTGIHQALFESLPQYLAVLDADGCVLTTNAVWNAYGLAHGHAYHDGFAKLAYAELLDAVTGGVEQTKLAALAGIADVISDKTRRFQMEYSFQAGMELRSFIMNVMAVRDGRARALVSHQEVSRFRQQDAASGPLDEAQGRLVKCIR